MRTKRKAAGAYFLLSNAPLFSRNGEIVMPEVATFSCQTVVAKDLTKNNLIEVCQLGINQLFLECSGQHLTHRASSDLSTFYTV